MTHLEFVASELLGGGTLSFHTTLVLTALGTWTGQNTMSSQGTPKKVKLRLVRSIDGDLSIQSMFFAHFVQLRLIPYSIPLY